MFDFFQKWIFITLPAEVLYKEQEAWIAILSLTNNWIQYYKHQCM